MNVYAVSDIHADHEANRAWLDALPREKYRDDILLVAGDVSHRLDILKKTLSTLKERFLEVFFVPGNHDLWVTSKESCDSLEKFYALRALCDDLGVHTRRRCFTTAASPLQIVPLLSWYSMPEESADTLYVPDGSSHELLGAWADLHLIRWPDRRPNAICDFFLRLNEKPDGTRPSQDVITFSHFLPRKELLFCPALPRKDGALPFNFSAVAGTLALERQIRREGASIHVYGHQHRNGRHLIDGVRYVECCVGYETERAKGQLWLGEDIPTLIWTDVPDDSEREFS
ncbi:metallophosphoesterase [Variovorax paradoxus]|uniref:metallophosphoesterase n=1 Tax=Variovorax paradoxus TaxID=34073 RepID=UPI003ECEC4CD